ncbi:class I SAM-dependent methyltransferase [Shimia sp. CNT1-13L.2]|uniref:class I SAM-dependent methyltransferase n=1 Tax=Shimia sp. CNT1-13L.2 TaxID=2959663 RepID=UPI0020CCF6DC|nr:class I SAM-dependent methyltransferase [Shimia sp. CNT1-13L.2]MCP9482846.1 class I SAM-dependent methyltransferase [Shimia sp. CNT1-13L.2]
MSHSRLTLAIEDNGLTLPEAGEIAVFAPRAGFDLSALPRERCRVIQPLRPDYEAYERAGYACDVAESGHYAAALVCLPRAKKQAHDLIARAVACADVVIVDGQKTEGSDSILKECRKRAEVAGVVAKAHGKLFWFSGGDFADWVAPEWQEVDGFLTRAGVFSADGIDPASKMLAAALPAKLGRNVADLGAGWGYLSRDILSRESVETLYLVEADHAALDCARKNVEDARAAFHWADVTRWEARARMDSVVMNPPFHTGRSAEPALGVAFIEAAARMLAPSGQLWMVANRHLPYETALNAAFGQVEEIAGDGRFKVLHASRPSRARR